MDRRAPHLLVLRSVECGLVGSRDDVRTSVAHLISASATSRATDVIAYGQNISMLASVANITGVFFLL